MDDRPRDILRQRFEPIRVVSSQSDIERENILHLAAVDRTVTDRSPNCSESVQKSLFAFVFRALEKGTLHRWKDRLQKTARVFNALTCHLEHQMMFVIVATLLHSTRQMIREEPASRLQDLVAQVRWKEA